MVGAAACSAAACHREIGQIVFQASFPSASELTLMVTVTGGTVPIDGIIVR